MSTTRLIKVLFRLGVVVFLLGGLCIVVGQALGLAAGDVGWVASVETAVGPPTFITAGVTGLLAYALTYVKAAEPGPEADPSPAPEAQPAHVAPRSE
ncbi:hypothetical protein FNH08_07985 [Streptomyces spongiae]|uniref:Uncharacterized protein n=1 Tax=Streptomyces spongiae TaxID=565072 RepID=A0A5N8XCJ3_9ACTN|nr:hypothetical protein [Streptomyces spongiae]